MTPTGLWDSHYKGIKAPYPYGDETTYKLAAEWVKGCRPVEDWGCGPAYLKQFCEPLTYIGVDGSASPFADVIDDVATRITQTEGLVIRHLLEHCYNWADILDNAVASFTKKMVIVLFTPLSAETHVMSTEPEFGDVPNISFSDRDLTDHLEGLKWSLEVLPQPTTYFGLETVIRVQR